MAGLDSCGIRVHVRGLDSGPYHEGRFIGWRESMQTRVSLEAYGHGTGRNLDESPAFLC